MIGTGEGFSLATSRLRLREWRDDDATAMTAINRDPRVTRYLNRPVDDAAIAGVVDSVRKHWERHGFGFFAVDSLEDVDVDAQRFIGFVGVAYPTFIPELSTRPERSIGSSACFVPIGSPFAHRVIDRALVPATSANSAGREPSCRIGLLATARAVPVHRGTAGPLASSRRPRGRMRCSGRRTPHPPDAG